MVKNKKRNRSSRHDCMCSGFDSRTAQLLCDPQFVVSGLGLIITKLLSVPSTCAGSNKQGDIVTQVLSRFVGSGMAACGVSVIQCTMDCTRTIMSVIITLPHVRTFSFVVGLSLQTYKIMYTLHSGLKEQFVDYTKICFVLKSNPLHVSRLYFYKSVDILKSLLLSLKNTIKTASKNVR
ncbi:hypothetical protein SFRURICE_018960 [Spodoptera frugiperda]|uniref:SFRICE_017419 n=1 Tax=Spodoptera frugiperda TaxID=7108 RepID=A0A2H1WV11_SPOFR|nr:hypothetical protein SFRURICE_018960 [Spodoptera frugiperda]